MKRDAGLFIEDILENVNLILNSVKDLSKKDFKKNLDVRDASIRRIEVIGEAVKNVPDKFKRKYPEIEWRRIAGTRDVLIHSYFGVDLDLTWKIIERDLPILKKEIEKIIEEM